MDLSDADGREERFTEKCRDKEKDIWLELQDEDWAEKFAYANISDTNRMLGEIFAIVAKYKSKQIKANSSQQVNDLSITSFFYIFGKIDQEVERIAEFQTKMEG